jgi:hypothetical protein
MRRNWGPLEDWSEAYDGLFNHQPRPVSQCIGYCLILIQKKFRDYVTLVDLIGVFYQIRDDYLNLRSPIVRRA